MSYLNITRFVFIMDINNKLKGCKKLLRNGGLSLKLLFFLLLLSAHKLYFYKCTDSGYWLKQFVKERLKIVLVKIRTKAYESVQITSAVERKKQNFEYFVHGDPSIPLVQVVLSLKSLVKK